MLEVVFGRWKLLILQIETPRPDVWRVLRQGHLDTQDAKVDSNQPIVASSGALQHIISTYLNGTLTNISAAFQESSEYISGALGVPPTFVYSGLAALVALPITMSRYGWSLSREQSFGAMSGGVPDVTNEDFSYITAQDLDDPRVEYSDSRYYPRPPSRGPSEPEDDILLIKNKGVTYPAHFPAYSIGDGKLYVKDVRERIGILMDLSSRTTRRIKLLYKGKQLKESSIPVREYGVKNKSELMAVIPDAEDGNSGRSDDEMIIVDEPSRNDTKTSRPCKKKRSKRKSDKNVAGSPTSPVDSGSNGDAANAPSPTAVNAAMQKLDEISDDFHLQWLPLCRDYVDATPKDAKKRDEEHRKLSESIMQQIILKLDGVETEGVDEIRQRRKDLVRRVQEVLKQLDVAKAL
ncbi:BAG domain-containing protein [Trichoderma ceciliae]